MHSSLQVLGIPKETVEFHRAANSLDELMAMAEAMYRILARDLHPDRNTNPGANLLLMRLTDAIEDLRDPHGLVLAIERQVNETNKHTNRHLVDDASMRDREKQSLKAALGLLKNIGQFNVFGIAQATSFLLQFGTSRTILDVAANNQAILNLTTQQPEVLPERAEYTEGHWREMYLKDETEQWLTHQSVASMFVTVVGFIPLEALQYRADETFQIILDDRVQLNDALSTLRSTPVWSKPTQAWYLPYLEAKPKKNSEVVARNHRGRLAIIGSIRAQALL